MRRATVLVVLAGLVLNAGLGLNAAPRETYTFWVEPCRHPETGCQTDDVELAAWALEAWQSASNGQLVFSPVTDAKKAQIRVYWASAQQGLYGETRPIRVDGRRGAEVYILPTAQDTTADRLARDAVVYLTCLHESGHALGLAHTDAFEDIMYSFQYGGDIPEYFARYRRKLAGRADIRRNSGMSPADRKHLLDALAGRR